MAVRPDSKRWGESSRRSTAGLIPGSAAVYHVLREEGMVVVAFTDTADDYEDHDRVIPIGEDSSERPEVRRSASWALEDSTSIRLPWPVSSSRDLALSLHNPLAGPEMIVDSARTDPNAKATIRLIPSPPSNASILGSPLRRHLA